MTSEWLQRARRLFDKLAEVEGRPTARPYLAHKAWLVSTRSLPWLIGGAVLRRRRLPALHRVKLIGLAARGALPVTGRVPLASRADALQLSDDGARLRAFYLGEAPRTLKILDLKRKPAELQEPVLRSRAAALGTVRVPRVLASRTEDGLAITEDELVFGRRLMPRYDLALIRDRLVPQLVATYHAAGLVYEPITHVLDAATFAAARGNDLADRARRILERAPLVAVGFCHGDLLASNLVVADGEVIVLDWESAGRGVLALDLLKLALRYPRNGALRAVVLDAIRRHLTAKGASADELLTLAAARLSVQAERRRIARPA